MNPSAKQRVLIIDDEESMRLLLGRLVESLPGVEVALAASCEEALRLARDSVYDAILLDLLMPGIGGLEVLKRIRGASPNGKTPVIVVSVMSDQETRIVCMSMGVSEYIVKPIERNSFVAVVKAQLARQDKPKSTGT